MIRLERFNSRSSAGLDYGNSSSSSLIVLFVFGAKWIPEIAQGLGKGIMEFKTRRP
jgi:hypothetical protein